MSRVTAAATLRFEGSSFLGGATFRAADLSGRVSFQWVTAGNLLDFNGTIFKGDAIFFGLTSTGVFRIRNVLFGGDRVDLRNVVTEDFLLDLALVEQVPRSEVATKFLGLEEGLVLVEQTARERGDLLLANEAKYQLLLLQGEELRGSDRFFDFLYREAAGYLVRPSVPLMNLGLLVLGVTVVRALVRLGKWGYRWFRRSKAERKRRLRPFQSYLSRLPATIGNASAKVLGVLYRRVAIALTIKPRTGTNNADTEEVSARAIAYWIEYLPYKVLEAAFLISLGNANPTARQLIDAVLKGGRP
jgi:hypothetical protein